MQYTNRKASRFLDFEAEAFQPIHSRARITDLTEYRARDRKRRVPRDLAWQLVGGDAA